MRYYVEINGESSLNIQGLMIQSLPSISKPLMRSKQETIDGRDGDIVTKLGYSAYDKTLKIGLWGNYDINEVIAFFNQEGTITFSNEPDKYYRFTILNRDDYVSQLDKFRTCTIALHCQPYKYKLNEEAEELENEYVEQEGTSLSFTNTLEAPMGIDLKGNTLQNGTPTPSSPIPINNVSGDNQVNVVGKNHYNINVNYDWIGSNTNYTITGNTINVNGKYFVASLQNVKQNTNYTISATRQIIQDNNTCGTIRIFTQDKSQMLGEGKTTFTFNTGNNSQIYVLLYAGLNQQGNVNFSNIQLEKGNQATTYEAYNGTTYNIDLPVENLCNGINQGYWLNQAANSCGKSTYDSGLVVAVNGGNYTISTSASQTRYRVACLTSLPDSSQVSSYNGVNKDNTSDSITINTTGYNYLIVNATDLTKIQIEYGSKANTYTPFGTTPIELNKIGTYQDRPFKAVNGDKFYDSLDNATKQTLTYGKWYLHKEIGKYTFTGDETFTLQNSNKRAHILNTNNQLGDILKTTGGTGILYGMYCNKLEEKTANQTWTGTQGISYDYNSGANQEDIDISINGLTTIDQYKSAINGITMYFILNTPTNIEITYTNLIEQLESIKNAMSKEGTTNVNQVNNDVPFIINASVLSGTDSITLTNEGNATSKPTLTITGSGVVGVYLENIQMFNISLGTNETIIIDTENMEAYYGSQLKNRQVTGDYSNFALQSGTNNLKFTGLVTNVEITNYNRWI